MAQKDSKINIQHSESSAILARASKEDSQVMRTIAIESKKDSSSMKTMAILTMLFLPGTFLAVSTYTTTIYGTILTQCRPSLPCHSSIGTRRGIPL